MFSVSFFGEIIIFVKIKDWSSIGISCKYGYQGRPPDLGGGEQEIFSSDFGIARGFGSMLP